MTYLLLFQALYENQLISKVLMSSEDPIWSQNIKKGFISNFQLDHSAIKSFIFLNLQMMQHKEHYKRLFSDISSAPYKIEINNDSLYMKFNKTEVS